MAPSPEHDNEPKAPDKSDSKKSGTGTSKLRSELLDIDTSSSADLQVSHGYFGQWITLLVTVLSRDLVKREPLNILSVRAPYLLSSSHVWLFIREIIRNVLMYIICPSIFADILPVLKTFFTFYRSKKWPTIHHALNSTCCDKFDLLVIWTYKLWRKLVIFSREHINSFCSKNVINFILCKSYLSRFIFF